MARVQRQPRRQHAAVVRPAVLQGRAPAVVEQRRHVRAPRGPSNGAREQRRSCSRPHLEHVDAERSLCRRVDVACTNADNHARHAPGRRAVQRRLLQRQPRCVHRQNRERVRQRLRRCEVGRQVEREGRAKLHRLVRDRAQCRHPRVVHPQRHVRARCQVAVACRQRQHIHRAVRVRPARSVQRRQRRHPVQALVLVVVVQPRRQRPGCIRKIDAQRQARRNDDVGCDVERVVEQRPRGALLISKGRDDGWQVFAERIQRYGGHHQRLQIHAVGNRHVEQGAGQSIVLHSEQDRRQQRVQPANSSKRIHSADGCIGRHCGSAKGGHDELPCPSRCVVDHKRDDRRGRGDHQLSAAVDQRRVQRRHNRDAHRSRHCVHK